MNRKVYLVLIWSITFCVIIFSSVKRLVKTKGSFYDLKENFSMNFDDAWNNKSSDEQTKLPEFSKIVLNANVMSVKIQEGEARTIECRFSRPELKPVYKVENDVLIIKQKVSKSFFLRSQNCDLTVTVPKNTFITQAEIKVNVGEVKITDVEIQNLLTHLNIGEIQISDVQFDILKAKLNIGDFYVDNLNNIDDFNADLKVNVGEIKIKNNNCGRIFNKNGISDKEINVSLNIGEIILN